MTQPDLFRSTTTFVFDGNPCGEAPATPSLIVSSSTTTAPSPTNTMAAKAAALFRSRPNQWIDGQEFARICGCYAWRTRISDVRRAPFSMDIENRQRREGRRVISEYRLNVEGQS